MGISWVSPGNCYLVKSKNMQVISGLKVKQFSVKSLILNLYQLMISNKAFSTLY